MLHCHCGGKFISISELNVFVAISQYYNAALLKCCALVALEHVLALQYFFFAHVTTSVNICSCSSCILHITLHYWHSRRYGCVDVTYKLTTLLFSTFEVSVHGCTLYIVSLCIALSASTYISHARWCQCYSQCLKFQFTVVNCTLSHSVSHYQHVHISHVHGGVNVAVILNV